MLIYPVFIPQQGCPDRCIYCDQSSFQAVTGVDAVKVSREVAQFTSYHKQEAKQIAFYGGTFTGLTESERDKYYAIIEPFLDDDTTLRISTRPDKIDTGILQWCREHHIWTIELGVQDFNDSVLSASRRGYTGETAIHSCSLIRAAGFELGVQLMPGLPGSDRESDKYNGRILAEVRPEFVRLYPTVAIAGTELYQVWQQGKYQPLSLETAIGICADYHALCEAEGINIIKTGIPPLEKGTNFAGPYHPAFGELVAAELLIRSIESIFQPEKTVDVNPADISLLLGHQRYNQTKLLNRLKTCSIRIKTSSSIRKGGADISLGEPSFTIHKEI